MPFIDLKPTNSAGQQSGGAAPVNDNDQSTNQEVKPGLDMAKLAAEGALPVLPPQSSAIPPIGNDVRQIQGGDWDDKPEETPAAATNTDPIMEVVTPAEPSEVTAVELAASTAEQPPTLTEAKSVPLEPAPAEAQVVPQESAPAENTTEEESPASDDLASVLETLRASRASLAQYKPTTSATTESKPEVVEAQPVVVEPTPETPATPTVDAQSVQTTNHVTTDMNEGDDSELTLGVESSSTQEAPAAQQAVVEEAPVVETQPAVSEPPATNIPNLDLAQPSETQPIEVPAAEAQVNEPTNESLPEISAPEISTGSSAEATQEVPFSQLEQGLQTRTYTLTEMLTEAVNMGASDLHLTAGYRALARLDGKLTEIKSQVLVHEDILTMMADVVAKHKHVDLQHDLDIDVSHQLEEPKARFRVNIFYQQGTIGAVFRVIPEHIRTVEELKLPPVIKEFTSLPQGLVLVTGPTGSGKTTTLAALINQINTTEPKHITTIEDPIEYVYPKGVGLVDQRAVYIDTPDWHTSLRAVLRQDPNVVLIGEMRDTETMEAALTIAETGHLVFSTLHTNSAAQTIDRIIDAFPEEKQSQVRTQLASVLMAVVSQRLIPVSGGGRRVATEIMVVTPAIKNAIREQKVYQIDNIIQTSAELGMNTMEKSLVSLVREGVITPEAAQNYANRPEDVLTYLSKN